MTYATCPTCGNLHCPRVGHNQYLCPRCGKVRTYYPASFESGVKATAAAFRLRLARILEAAE